MASTDLRLPENLIDDAFWSSRCWFWRDQVAGALSQRAKRQREPNPLILSGFGISLRIEGGTLRIRNGFTHHPQKAETYRFFRGDRDLPRRIILLDGAGSISFDVLSWLSEQGVAFIRIDWRGEVICLASPSGYSANSFRVDWQRETRAVPNLRMSFCVSLITAKIDSTILALEKSIRRSNAWETAMQIAYSSLTRLSEIPPVEVAELRGIEGVMAAAYFRAWTGIPIKWRKRSRKFIPEAWRFAGIRGSRYYATGNQNAQHPLNAILNYAYTVLRSEIQIWSVVEGYDPSIGIMHEFRSDASAFVFDLMEPRRADVDQRVLAFVRDTEFDPADFMILADGCCRLNPELARRIAHLVSGISAVRPM